MKFIDSFAINTISSSIGSILCVHIVVIVVLTILGKNIFKIRCVWHCLCHQLTICEVGLSLGQGFGICLIAAAA